MSDATVGNISHGVNVDTLIAISKLGEEIATFCNESKIVSKQARPQKVTLTRGAAVSEESMIAFGAINDMEWGFAVLLGDADRLWFCRNIDDADDVYRFEDSVHPQECSEQEYARLINCLSALLRGLTMA